MRKAAQPLRRNSRTPHSVDRISQRSALTCRELVRSVSTTNTLSPQGCPHIAQVAIVRFRLPRNINLSIEAFETKINEHKRSSLSLQVNTAIAEIPTNTPLAVSSKALASSGKPPALTISGSCTIHRCFASNSETRGYCLKTFITRAFFKLGRSIPANIELKMPSGVAK